MTSSFGVYLIGIGAMVVVYFALKWIVGKRRVISFHLVERVIIFCIALIFVLVAIFVK
jgi:hypothetical protein